MWITRLIVAWNVREGVLSVQLKEIVRNVLRCFTIIRAVVSCVIRCLLVVLPVRISLVLIVSLDILCSRGSVGLARIRVWNASLLSRVMCAQMDIF